MALGDVFEGVGEVIKSSAPCEHSPALQDPWVQKQTCKLEPQYRKLTNISLHPSLRKIQLCQDFSTSQLSLVRRQLFKAEDHFLSNSIKIVKESCACSN